MNLKFVIETDLGHDPDDLFAICHLLEAGHEILAIGLVPGSPEQIRLATGLRHHLGLNFPVGVAKPDARPERLGIHDRMMERFAFRGSAHDGPSCDIFFRALTKEPNAEVLVIGPAPGLRRAVGLARGRLTMQGGFLPYSIWRPTGIRPLEKFEGKESVSSFNVNGCPAAVDAILAAPLAERRFCGKNVCHGVVLTKDKLSRYEPPRSEAGVIYLATAEMYFKYHDEKKLHDPTALVCHTHPNVGTWFTGRPVRAGAGWTTVESGDGTCVLADVDEELLWEHLSERS